MRRYALVACSVAFFVGCGAAPAHPAGVGMSPSTKRFVLEPDSMAFVFDDGDEGERPAAPLGAKVGTHARLLLRFPLLASPGTIDRAWLVLDRVQGAEAGPGEVTLRADAIVEPWTTASEGTALHWSSPPKSEPIVGASSVAPARAQTPIRIDVTAWAQKLARKGPRPWGLRVEGSGDGYGVPIATGAGNGRPPRLEVFVQ
jgi:hypothetical protein